ncbi:MAG: phosphoglycerate kinase [archaeon]
MRKLKTLDDFDFNSMRVLVRADLNSNVVNGKVVMSERIIAASNTISELKKKKAKVVIIAHQGRPGREDFIGLDQHAKLLSKITKVDFVDSITGMKALMAIRGLEEGEALLLENIRMEKDEYKPEKGRENKLIKKIAPLFDIYVNDAFSNSHRKHASMVLFPKYLPSCGGRLLEYELRALNKIKMKNSLYILGGAKPEEDIKLLKGNKVLACGLFGQACLIAQGKRFGAQNKYLYENKYINKELIGKLKKKLKNVKYPRDFAVSVHGKRRELKIDEFPSIYEIFDIGKETIEDYVDEIKKAKSIYMKGPAGLSSDKRFSRGTMKILKAISKNKGFSVIGGGHLADTIRKSGISFKKFGYISLSGGALLRYIAGEKLVGIEALK